MAFIFYQSGFFFFGNTTIQLVHSAIYIIKIYSHPLDEMKTEIATLGFCVYKKWQIGKHFTGTGEDYILMISPISKYIHFKQRNYRNTCLRLFLHI